MIWSITSPGTGRTAPVARSTTVSWHSRAPSQREVEQRPGRVGQRHRRPLPVDAQLLTLDGGPVEAAGALQRQGARTVVAEHRGEAGERDGAGGRGAVEAHPLDGHLLAVHRVVPHPHLVGFRRRRHAGASVPLFSGSDHAARVTAGVSGPSATP